MLKVANTLVSSDMVAYRDREDIADERSSRNKQDREIALDMPCTFF
jgi:hypothetical protein